MTEATEAPATEDAPLSDDEAVALIENPPAEAEDAPAEAEDDQPEGEDAEDEAEAEEEGEDEPEAEAVAPPPFWSAEDKAAFAKAPPEVQQAILEHENNRNRAAERFIQQNTQEAAQYRAKVQELDQLLAAAKANEELFGQIDWQQWLKDNPGEALAAQMTAQQLQAAKAEAEQRELAQFRQEEGRKLPTIDPELADQAKLGKVFHYIAQNGIPPEQLGYVGAIELAIAHKAMKWDEAQARAKTGKPRAPEPPRKPVKPTSASAATPQREAQALRNRFAQTRSADDAVELIKTLGL